MSENPLVGWNYFPGFGVFEAPRPSLAFLVVPIDSNPVEIPHLKAGYEFLATRPFELRGVYGQFSENDFLVRPPGK